MMTGFLASQGITCSEKCIASSLRRVTPVAFHFDLCGPFVQNNQLSVGLVCL